GRLGRDLRLSGHDRRKPHAATGQTLRTGGRNRRPGGDHQGRAAGRSGGQGPSARRRDRERPGQADPFHPGPATGPHRRGP
ncbi:MAG: hypothetical protein AMXMBFR83_22450, partial [Phycisphaerae bacterium]